MIYNLYVEFLKTTLIKTESNGGYPEGRIGQILFKGTKLQVVTCKP